MLQPKCHHNDLISYSFVSRIFSKHSTDVNAFDSGLGLRQVNPHLFPLKKALVLRPFSRKDLRETGAARNYGRFRSKIVTDTSAVANQASIRAPTGVLRGRDRVPPQKRTTAHQGAPLSDRKRRMRLVHQGTPLHWRKMYRLGSRRRPTVPGNSGTNCVGKTGLRRTWGRKQHAHRS